MHSPILRFVFLLLTSIPCHTSYGQQSVARQWNEVLLESIRKDFARPTVHARNLFHISAASYDSWALFTGKAEPYLIGNEVHGFNSSFDGYHPPSSDTDALRNKVISYACYRLILHRFASSPGRNETYKNANNLMTSLGYDIAFASSDYSNGSAAALGNYIAQTYISYGLLDGANEQNDYRNQAYKEVNSFLDPTTPGNANLTDPNRWQPLAFDVFIDQSGNEIPGTVPDFLSPEWGQVLPFSLKDKDKITHTRDGFDYHLYNDPGPPPYLEASGTGLSDEYKWGFSMVAIWSGHLDSSNETQIDISPASLGNVDITTIPDSFIDYDSFYPYLDGGDIGKGYDINPSTLQPYDPQLVSVGDYGRVLAEFWADGPDSETPPGHWFTLLNYVSDHPLFEKQFSGNGDILSDLEWDVKSYFILGGAMHDAAIAAWGIKGYYDYIRPISAIRYLADRGQSSDTMLPRYDAQGMLLVDNHIELVMEGDPLVGLNNEHLYKIKLKAWKGPEYIIDPQVEEAGVDWILAENWWPYQRPTFVTPPFAGYISGHSTFSRAAAEVMTLLTGDPYFPGGMGEFLAKKNEFLVFEEGPSQDITLQWATYRDASDQCSLSRIWGGIHPPADDLPGRVIGEKIGIDAFAFSIGLFENTITGFEDSGEAPEIYPNPVTDKIRLRFNEKISEISLIDGTGKLLKTVDKDASSLDVSNLKRGIYFIKVVSQSWEKTFKVVKE